MPLRACWRACVKAALIWARDEGWNPGLDDVGPVGGQLARHPALELGGQLWEGVTVGVHTLAPIGVSRSATGAGIPGGKHIGRHFPGLHSETARSHRFAHQRSIEERAGPMIQRRMCDPARLEINIQNLRTAMQQGLDQMAADKPAAAGDRAARRPRGRRSRRTRGSPSRRRSLRARGRRSPGGCG